MYTTVKISCIPDMDSFFRTIDTCSRPVFLMSGDKELFDLRNDENAREMMRALAGCPFHGILSLKTDRDDSSRFISYMLGMAMA